MFSRGAKLVRRVALWSLCWTKWYRSTCERAMFTEVGLTGHVSLIDDSIATERKLNPLNRVEKWLLKDDIAAAKQQGRDAFRQACIDVMGEDPYDDGYCV